MTCSKSHSLNSKDSNPGLTVPSVTSTKVTLCFGEGPEEGAGWQRWKSQLKRPNLITRVTMKRKKWGGLLNFTMPGPATLSLANLPTLSPLSPWVAEIPHQHPIPSLSQTESQSELSQGPVSVGDCCCFLTQTSGNSNLGNSGEERGELTWKQSELKTGLRPPQAGPAPGPESQAENWLSVKDFFKSSISREGTSGFSIPPPLGKGSPSVSLLMVLSPWLHSAPPHLQTQGGSLAILGMAVLKGSSVS